MAVHTSTKYAKDVLSGKIIAGKWVKLACLRHLNDLKRPELFFDSKKADYVVEAISNLKHSKGERFGTKYNEGHFAVIGFDPADPPVYES